MPMLTPVNTSTAFGSMLRSDLLAGLQWLAIEADCSGLQMYVVGGSVRDMLLHRPCADVDLVCTLNPTPAARNLARSCGGHWFWLDRERGYSRVVVNTRNQPPAQFDFSPLRADSLEADLALRDYTINAMAIDIQQFRPDPKNKFHIQAQALIDPLNAQEHLRRHELHLCSEDVLQHDPLRIIKGLRHCATLGMRLSHAATQACCQAAPGLSQVAPERIRSEIAHIFTATNLTHLGYSLHMLHTCAIDSALHLPTCDIGATRARMASAFSSMDLIARSSAYLNLRLNWNAGDEFSLRSLGMFGMYLRPTQPRHSAVCNPAQQLKLSHAGGAWLDWLRNCNADIMEQLHQIAGYTHPRRALRHLEHLGAPLPHGLAALTFFCRHTQDVNLVASLWHITSVCIHQGRIKPLLGAANISTEYPHLTGKKLGMCLHQLATAERQGIITTTAEAWTWVKHYTHCSDTPTKGHGK